MPRYEARQGGPGNRFSVWDATLQQWGGDYVLMQTAQCVAARLNRVYNEASAVMDASLRRSSELEPATLVLSPVNPFVQLDHLAAHTAIPECRGCKLARGMLVLLGAVLVGLVVGSVMPDPNPNGDSVPDRSSMGIVILPGNNRTFEPLHVDIYDNSYRR